MTTTTPPPINNTQPVSMDYGPIVNGQYAGFNNTLYTTVIICVPGTTTCQSHRPCSCRYGFHRLRIRVFVVTLSLPFVTDASNNPIGNCVQYADTTYQWGPLVKVDVKWRKLASSVPIQIVGPTEFPRRSFVLHRGRDARSRPYRIWEPMEFWASVCSVRTAARPARRVASCSVLHLSGFGLHRRPRCAWGAVAESGMDVPAG